MSKTNLDDESELLLLVDCCRFCCHLRFYLFSTQPRAGFSLPENFPRSPYGSKECCRGKNEKSFLCCLFVWLWRITLNGSFFTLMASFISFMFKFLSALNARETNSHEKTNGKVFFSLQTCSNSIFLVLSFRIRHASSFEFFFLFALIAAKSVTNKQETSVQGEWQWAWKCDGNRKVSVGILIIWKVTTDRETICLLWKMIRDK